jgi:hypothetical protein
MMTVHETHPTAILNHIDLDLVAAREKRPGEKLLA